MRIYEGSPRQDFEEVFRSIGAFLDQRGMKDVLLVEAPDGFIVQGLVDVAAGRRRLVRVDRDPGQGDADVPRRRHRSVHGGSRRPTRARPGAAHRHPPIGGLLRDRVPRARPLHGRAEADATCSSSSRTARSSSGCCWARQAGSQHQLAEFTREDITQMVAADPPPQPGHHPRSGQHDQRLTSRTQIRRPPSADHRRYSP